MSLTPLSFPDLFSGHAAAYAAARPAYPTALLDTIADLSPSQRCVWDCGTGNGQAASALARYFATVYASDPSWPQIQQAAEPRRVRYSVQTAERSAFASGSFDAVCVAQALHWFQLEAFFREVRRVSRPGALLAVWGYAWFQVTPEFDRAFERHLRPLIDPFWAPQNRLLWDGYRDVTFPFPPLSAPSCAIQLHWTFPQLMAYVATWSALQRCRAAGGLEDLIAAGQILQSQWGEADTLREVTMPLHIWLGRLP